MVVPPGSTTCDEKTRGVEFVRPTLEHRAAFADWLDDWRGDSYNPYDGVFEIAWTDFDAYISLVERLRIEGSPPGIDVPLDTIWAFEGRKLVGDLFLFYEPMQADNNIGYKVRPSARRRGIATLLTRYGLDRLRERGKTEARLTCREDNIASAAVIEGCGGLRRDDKVTAKGHVMRRYIIPITA